MLFGVGEQIQQFPEAVQEVKWSKMQDITVETCSNKLWCSELFFCKELGGTL